MTTQAISGLIDCFNERGDGGWCVDSLVMVVCQIVPVALLTLPTLSPLQLSISLSNVSRLSRSQVCKLGDPLAGVSILIPRPS